MSVADYGVGDTPHQRSPHSTSPAAAHDYEPRSQLLSEPDDLPVRLSNTHVSRRELAASSLYLPCLLIELCLGLLLGALEHLVPKVEVDKVRVGSVVRAQRSSHADNV